MQRILKCCFNRKLENLYEKSKKLVLLCYHVLALSVER